METESVGWKCQDNMSVCDIFAIEDKMKKTVKNTNN